MAVSSLSSDRAVSCISPVLIVYMYACVYIVIRQCLWCRLTAVSLVSCVIKTSVHVCMYVIWQCLWSRVTAVSLEWCDIKTSCAFGYVYIAIWGGYGSYDRLNYRSLLQNILSFVGLFCKRDL